MAFPTIVQSTSSDDGEVTNPTVDLPPTLTTGNLLVLQFAIRDDSTVTWPSGYTKLGSDIQSGNNNPTLSTAYRKIDGTEGSTITVTTGSSAKSVHIVYEIQDMADPDTQAPERSTGATSTSATPDPDSLAPTGGSKDYLFLAMHSQRNFNDTTAAPTNYSNLINEKGTSGTSLTCASADRALTASSDDPGVFTTGASAAWCACTIAVHPATGMLPFSRPLMTGGMDDMPGGMTH